MPKFIRNAYFLNAYFLIHQKTGVNCWEKLQQLFFSILEPLGSLKNHKIKHAYDKHIEE